MSTERRRTWLRRAAAAGLAVPATALCVFAVPVLGQESGGPLFTFGVSTSLRASDNLDLETVSAGNTALSETRLFFGFESVTRIQAFRFSVSDLFRVGDGPGAPANAGFRGPDANLSYERTGSNSRFEFAAGLRTRDLDADLTDADLEDPDALVVDPGTLVTSTLSFGFETGLEGPFGAELSLSQTRRDYTDTINTDFEDSTTRAGEVALIFRPDPLLETRLAYRHVEYEAEDARGTERLTRGLSFGAEWQLDPATRVSGSLGWTVIEETWTSVPRTLPDETGITASLGYFHELPNGDIAVELSHDVTSAGGRTDVNVTRGFDLRTGELVLTFGATRPEDGDILPTGSIAYSREFPDQAFRVALSSDISVNSDSDVQRNTRASLDYSLALTEIDSLAFDVSYYWVTDAGSGTVTDYTRATATASYSRELNHDWTLTTGYTHRLRHEDGVGTARANEVFLKLGREFAWRP